ncbi:MAG: hypothetical protein ACFB15_19360 [Cyclobacteriaceae bacterium]
MRRVCYFLGLILLSSACATLNRTTVSDPNKRDGLQELQLSTGYDVYGLRIDLIRQVTTDGDGNSCPMPYHYLGVNLGNGLFYDANNNLTLNLDQLPELRQVEDFTIRKRERGRWNRIETYRKHDQLFSRERNGLLSSNTEAYLGESTIVVDEGFLSSKQTIQIGENSIEYKGGLAKATLTEHSDHILLKEFLHRDDYRQQENRIYLERDYLEEDRGNVIEITQIRGLVRPSYYFIKVDNSYYFFNQRYRGVKITISGSEVLVEDNGRDQAIFLVENMN